MKKSKAARLGWMELLFRASVSIYWAGLVAVWLAGWWWVAIGQDWLGLHMPFLPLMGLSVYCSLGVMGLFAWASWEVCWLR